MTKVVAAPPPSRGSLANPAAHHPFPDLLHSHRKRAGLTQRALADLSTVSARAIRDLEAGRASPRTQTIDLLADALRLHGLVRQVFIHAAVSGRCGGPADADLAAMVPKPVNILRGREAEVRDMAGALESGRLRMISISGLPGVGKTRVAVEVAARLTSRRGWPVLWIGRDLQTMTGGGTGLGPLIRLLRSLIGSHGETASDRSIEDSGQVPRDGVSGVRRIVGEYEVLLVLDGVADVMTPVGVADLLAYCPGVRVVSTSRTPWELAGVQTAVLSPLATPEPDWDRAAAPLDVLAAVPAVRLLLDRLAEIRPGFGLDTANASAAAELSRRLDGLPLALEAVTQQSRVLSLQQLAELPEADLLDLPVQAGPGATPQTLGGLIGSCYEHLDAAQRTILRQLRGFERPWTVADAAALLHRPLHEVMEYLNILIGRGLVSASHCEPTADLHLPNLLRASLLAEVGRAGDSMREPRTSTRPRPVRVVDHARQPHIRGVVSTTSQNARLSYLPTDPSNEGESMAFNSAESLREAGLLGAPSGTLPPKVEEFFSSLTKEEVDVLISTKNRLDQILPEVEAHSEAWSSPEATQQGFDAAMLCACGAWSGSGEQV